MPLTDRLRHAGGSRVQAVHRLFIAAAVLMAGSAHAQIDPKVKAECMKAQDFAGCVRALSAETIKEDVKMPFLELRNSMLKVAARLEAGTSLNSLEAAIQPLVDELALAKGKTQDDEVVKAASKASEMLTVFRQAVQARIDSGKPTVFNNKTRYSCNVLIQGIANFNRIAGEQAATAGCKKNWLDVASEEEADSNEMSMLRFVSSFLKESAGSIASPKSNN